MAKSLANRPGLRHCAPRPHLLGNDQDDWRSYITISGMSDTHAIIPLGDEYVVSLGAHGMHTNLLMDHAAKSPLTVERSFHCCALLSFVFDTPIVPHHYPSERLAQETPDRSAFASRFAGLGGTKLEQYCEALSETALLCNDLYEWKECGASADRFPADEPDRWSYISMPSRREVWRALMAYWSGLLSIPIQGRILNFWRATEAAVMVDGTTQSSLKKMQPLFQGLDTARVEPVQATVRHMVGGHARRSNLIRRLRRAALQEQAAMLTDVGGSHDAVLNRLCDKRRGKAAHADREALEYDQLGFLGDHVRQAMLLQYFARVAIEAGWG